MPRFQKGVSGNPKGRPPVGQSEIDMLRAALSKVEAERGVPFSEHFIHRAYEDDAVLVAVARKLTPDLKQVDQQIDLSRQYGVIVMPTKVPVGAECADSEIDTGENGK